MSEAAKQKAQKLIDENAVMVFSKSYCPYCTATKSKLKDIGAKYNVLELDQIGKLDLLFSVISTFHLCRLFHLY